MAQLGWLYFSAPAAGGSFSATWKGILIRNSSPNTTTVETVGGDASLVIYAQQSIGMSITGAPFTQSTSTENVNGNSETVDTWTISASDSYTFGGAFNVDFGAQSFSITTTALSGTVGIKVSSTMTAFSDGGSTTVSRRAVESLFESGITRRAIDEYDEVESLSFPRWQNSANGTIRWGDLVTKYLR